MCRNKYNDEFRKGNNNLLSNSAAEIFEASPEAVFITDENGTVIWENTVYRNMFCEAEERSVFAAAVLNECKGSNCGCIAYSEKYYRINFIPLGKDRIAEINEKGSLADMLAISGIRSYLMYAFMRIRQCAATTSKAADEIYALLAESKAHAADGLSRQLIDKLNDIDGDAAALIAELANPEQLLYLSVGTDCDYTVNLSSEAKLLVKAAQSSAAAVNKKLKFCTKLDESCYAHIGRSAFRTLLADIISFCAENSESSSEVMIELSQNDGMAKITVSCRKTLNLSAESTDSNIFFEYLCDMFCSKYNGSFTKRVTNKSVCCCLEFGALDGCSVSVSSPMIYDDTENDEKAIKAIFYSKNKYKYFKEN